MRDEVLVLTHELDTGSRADVSRADGSRAGVDISAGAGAGAGAILNAGSVSGSVTGKAANGSSIYGARGGGGGGREEERVGGRERVDDGGDDDEGEEEGEEEEEEETGRLLLEKELSIAGAEVSQIDEDMTAAPAHTYPPMPAAKWFIRDLGATTPAATMETISKEVEDTIQEEEKEQMGEQEEMEEKRKRKRSAAASASHEAEIARLTEAWEMIDSCRDVIDSYTALKPFKMLGFKIYASTAATVFTTGVSFFGVLFSIYSSAADKEE